MTGVDSSDLLDAATVVEYLIGRRVLDRPAEATVARLSGGVSNVVLRVDTPAQAVVLKQALGKLAVADDWYADRGRAQHEAEALRLLSGITPDSVPAVLDDDSDAFTVTIEAAPSDWVTWKVRLMDGVADASVAACLGDLLRTWHAATAGLPLGGGLDSFEAFRQLRVHPYFEVSAARAPELSANLLTIADELTSRQECLVLGDFSPKNVLVGGVGDVWVIDHEVAHRGDPAFDVAFMATHLVLKALHLPEARGDVSDCLGAFIAAYSDGLGQEDPDHTASVVGALLAARVIGSSPVEYLTDSEKSSVMSVASRLLGRASPATRSDEPFTKEIPWLVV